VRIHLGETGTPLCGEQVYDRPVHSKPILPENPRFPRPALHAAWLSFGHPTTQRRLSWTSRLPKDMHELLIRLRRERRGRASANDPSR
jgi:23S rRNA pseudouridine1911/1915/1917 synthase